MIFIRHLPNTFAFCFIDRVVSIAFKSLDDSLVFIMFFGNCQDIKMSKHTLKLPNKTTYNRSFPLGGSLCERNGYKVMFYNVFIDVASIRAVKKNIDNYY